MLALPDRALAEDCQTISQFLWDMVVLGLTRYWQEKEGLKKRTPVLPSRTYKNVDKTDFCSNII